jgi:hypothetical protein
MNTGPLTDSRSEPSLRSNDPPILVLVFLREKKLASPTAITHVVSMLLIRAA